MGCSKNYIMYWGYVQYNTIERSKSVHKLHKFSPLFLFIFHNDFPLFCMISSQQSLLSFYPIFIPMLHKFHEKTKTILQRYKQPFPYRKEQTAMKDVTAELFMENDVRKTPSVSQITRLSMIQNRLRKLEEKLDSSQPILTFVVTDDLTLVQKESGTIQTTLELIGYYNETHVINLTASPRQNAVVIRLKKRLREKCN